MKRLLLVGSLVLLVLFAVFSYSWYQVHTSLLLPNIPNNKTPSDYKLAYETRSFKTQDGVTLQGWYIPVKDAKATVIVVHGYREFKSERLEHAPYLHDGGYATFFIDLRSDSLETKTTLGVEEYKDVEAAYDYMKTLPENKNKKIGFFGGSMGASTSIIAAGKTGKGDFVIASVPYANFKSLFEQRIKLEKLPSFLLPFVRLANVAELGLQYEQYNPDKLIKNINKPIFLISSTQDIKVNSTDAKFLHALANEPKYLWEVKAQHDIFNDKPEEYKSHILKFLQTLN